MLSNTELSESGILKVAALAMPHAVRRDWQCRLKDVQCLRSSACPDCQNVLHCENGRPGKKVMLSIGVVTYRKFNIEPLRPNHIGNSTNR